MSKRKPSASLGAPKTPTSGLAPKSLADFGALQGRLAATENRPAVLKSAGLTEPSWEATERSWDSVIAGLIENAPSGVVPAELVAYHDAFVRGLAFRDERVPPTEAPLTLAQFAQATSIIERGGDPTPRFAAVGISLTDYLRASEYWNKQLGTDGEIATRFLQLREEVDLSS